MGIVGALALALVWRILATSHGERELPSHDFAEEFAQICRSLKESYETYYGELRLKELEQPLEATPGAARRSDQELARSLELALKLLEVDRADDALAVLDGARAHVANADDLLRVNWVQMVVHLQAAEDENCVLGHSAASCILPFRPEAEHQRPEHARRAGGLAEAILERDPDNIEARWLLNLSRMATGDFPAGVPERHRLPASALRSDEPMRAWRNRAPELGVDVVDLAGGAILDDFDGDGFLDLVTSTADPCDHPKAFRNDGRGGFEPVSSAWGLDTQFGGLNLVHADYDGDGDLDLLVLRGGWLKSHGRIRNSLLRNDLDAGRGFVDVTRDAGLAFPAYPTQTAAWADYDGDGDLDVYIGNERWTAELEHPSQLFRNEGDGTFTDVAAHAGVTNDRYAKAVAWGDYDNDGDPDLYVSNLGINRLYRNEGEGSFRDVASELDVERPFGRSFASWFFDYDNDGDLDLFVADYTSTDADVLAGMFGEARDNGRPLLYRNSGGHFREIGQSVGLTRPLLPMGANYGDIDNDGWLDVYLGTGEPAFDTLVPNVMLRNVEGVHFADVSYSGGFAHLQKGHGVAFGDVDNDGDQDLLHQLGGFFPGDAYANALFENPEAPGRWIVLRLEGRGANRFGVGARVEVRVRETGGLRSIHLLVGSGGSFGGSSFQQEIGLGAAERVEEVRVRWPGGDEQVLGDIALNRFYRIVEGSAQAIPIDVQKLRLRSGARPHTAHPGAEDRVDPAS